jgi:hypothetical protein
VTGSGCAKKNSIIVLLLLLLLAASCIVHWGVVASRGCALCTAAATAWVAVDVGVLTVETAAVVGSVCFLKDDCSHDP